MQRMCEAVNCQNLFLKAGNRKFCDEHRKSKVTDDVKIDHKDILNDSNDRIVDNVIEGLSKYLEECFLLKLLKRRGPDAHFELNTVINENISTYFFGAVLHQQGYAITKQPFQDDFGNILLWNGELYDINEEEICDTVYVANKLKNAAEVNEICDILSRANAEWSIIYWHEQTKKLWFGRDALGRRSLVLSYKSDDNSNYHLTLSSVGCLSCPCSFHNNENFIEFPADGLYSLNCKNYNHKTDVKHKFKIDWFPWTKSQIISGLPDLEVFSVKKSNWLLEPVLLNRTNLQLQIESKDLFTAAFADETFRAMIDDLQEKLTDAIRKRVDHKQAACKECYERDVACSHAKIAVLFSGGIDSAVIAAICDRVLDESEPIDLINVAFEQSRLNGLPKKKFETEEKYGADDAFDVPDRISGKQALHELSLINPKRHWNFIQVDVTKEQLSVMRTSHIAHLVYPRSTVLDDSIGCAIWFAAKGQGHLLSDNCEYTSQAKVVLVGMGADEQLAGYSRHRQVFKNGGLEGLLDEIQMEVDRIWSRNLGRDDRVICDHGREARFPFLDCNVMSFLSCLPMCYKADLTLPRGEGEKLILRLLAQKLGLTSICTLAKRAIQFGSRIAKMENRKEKASDQCSRLDV